MPRVIFDKQKQRRGSIESPSESAAGGGEFFRKNLRLNGATKGRLFSYDRSGGRENDDGSTDQSGDN